MSERETQRSKEVDTSTIDKFVKEAVENFQAQETFSDHGEKQPYFLHNACLDALVKTSLSPLGQVSILITETKVKPNDSRMQTDLELVEGQDTWERYFIEFAATILSNEVTLRHPDLKEENARRLDLI